VAPQFRRANMVGPAIHAIRGDALMTRIERPLHPPPALDCVDARADIVPHMERHASRKKDRIPCPVRPRVANEVFGRWTDTAFEAHGQAVTPPFAAGRCRRACFALNPGGICRALCALRSRPASSDIPVPKCRIAHLARSSDRGRGGPARSGDQRSSRLPADRGRHGWNRQECRAGRPRSATAWWHPTMR